MTDSQKIIDAFDSRAERRASRRAFFTQALGAAAIGVGGLIYADSVAAQTAANAGPQQDIDILNFALNLEYLEANFYSYAVFGTPINASLTTGSGTNGVASSATYNAGAHAVPFVSNAIKGYATEIAQDEINHVTFLRSALNAIAANTAVAQPTVDVGVSATSAFSTLMKVANSTNPNGAQIPLVNGIFDPYLSDDNFLLASFVFEDVGVTAYKGASPFVSNATYLSAAAGILAVEAYHASIVRTALYTRGYDTGGTAVPAAFGGGTYPARTPNPNLITYTQSISDARDSVDGSSDDDQGIANMVINGGTGSNIVPTDSNAIAYSRTTGSVLDIVYLTNKAATMGGFFPAGVNGNVKASTAQ